MANKKVLVVDDEIHIVHVVAIKLRNNGYEVATASNGAEAFEIACNEKPDIIVTDYQMPVMTGIQLVENIRAEASISDMPVILLTARSFAVEDEQTERLEISECLSKPFSPKELLRCIEDVLHERAVVQGR